MTKKWEGRVGSSKLILDWFDERKVEYLWKISGKNRIFK